MASSREKINPNPGNKHINNMARKKAQLEREQELPFDPKAIRTRVRIHKRSKPLKYRY